MRPFIGMSALCLAIFLTGCTASRPTPAPTLSSHESIADAFGRPQAVADIPKDVPTGSIDLHTLRLLAVIDPATWYVAQTQDGTGFCALAVWKANPGVTSGFKCISTTTFESSGLQMFLGDTERQSRIWIVTDTSSFPPHAGWSVLGPSVLIPTDGPFATPAQS